MSEAAEDITHQPVPPAIKKRRKQQRRRTAAPATKVAPFRAPDEFAGMTETDCCDECGPDRCVISGINICGHPFKGGQIPHGNQPAFERLMRAKKALAQRKLDPTKLG